MSVDSGEGWTNEAAWAGIRTILVPPDIVPVPRRSPPPVRKKTPWRPRPDGEVITERAGGRDWFSDRIFVEAQEGHRRTGWGSSIAVHIASAIVLTVVLLTRPVPTVRANGGSPLVMPVVAALMPIVEAPASRRSSPEQSARKIQPRPPGAAVAPAPGPIPAAPIEASSGITQETGAESGGGGIEGGIEGGIPGGIAGGGLGGALSGGAPSGGPLRPGRGIDRPLKIKDVTPVYPQSALTGQTRGTVVIEATIGIDGKVKDARVIHSVPALDQAALDAVKQWEYNPTRLDGVAVAVIITVIINFAIQ